MEDMRKWFKYYLDYSVKGFVRLSKDNDFKDHCRTMDYYDADEAYSSTQSFFKKYFFSYQLNRLQYYDNFLRLRLDKNWEVLSVASGRCANELYLNEDGYDIICSDLGLIASHADAKRLFPNFNFIQLDILKKPADKLFDALISLSLLYLFNEKGLELFFQNSAKSIRSKGHLIVDPGGCPDNTLSFLVDEIYLPLEVRLQQLYLLGVKKKVMGFVKKHQGYRTTDREIIKIAKKHGFELSAYRNYGFLTEFKRSLILKKIIESNPFIEDIFSKLGRMIPYIRMFDFQKIS